MAKIDHSHLPGIFLQPYITIDWEGIKRSVENNALLMEFLVKNHEYCHECEGSGKVYNNADPTSGQWVECSYSELMRKEGIVL